MSKKTAYLLAGLVAATVCWSAPARPAAAQDDPFGDPLPAPQPPAASPPERDLFSDDPGAPKQPRNAPSPPSIKKPPTNPFGDDPVPPRASAQPKPAQPQPAKAPQDPFGGDDGSKADPFGGGNQKADPFGLQDKPKAAPPRKARQDPFGGAPDADPFGVTPAKPKAGQPRKAPRDPFGGPGSPGDPFAPGEQPRAAQPRLLVGGAKTARSSGNEATLKTLADEMNADFLDFPIEEVLTHIGDMLDIQFHLDRRALEDVAISADTPVTLNLRGVPGEMVLDLILQDLDLDWYLRHGVVIVSTKEVVELRLTTVVYDVSKICRPAPQPDGGLAARQSDAMYTQFGGAAPKATKTPPSEVGQLAEVVRDSVAPESWNEQGGPSVIRTYRNALIITQTDKVHREVVDLLKQMEQAVAQ